MNKFAIMADATCDLSKDFQEQYDIKVLPGHVVLPDKTEVTAYPDWAIMPREEFYADLKKHPTDYATSPPNSQEFANAMEEFAKTGTDVLVITISSAISGAFGFACSGMKQVLEKYPEAKIHCVDSMRYGPGFGLMTVLAARLRDEGRTMEEVAQWLEDNKNRFHQAGWLDDLTFVARKGRLTNAKAFFGTLAGIKPIGEFDYNGLTTVIGKAKGAKAAYAALLEYIDKTIEDPEDQTIFIAQTSRLPQAEKYKELLQERFRPKEIFINDVHPFCGVNVGPGLMAAYYIGKPISSDLSEEKAILEKALAGSN